MAITEFKAGYPKAVPRVPSVYRPTEHYEARVACERRPITGYRADRAIVEGKVDENRDDDGVLRRDKSWRFNHVVDGVRVRTVVAEGNRPGDPRLIRITAFCEVVDRRAASWSSEWSEDEIAVMTLLATLSGDRRGGKPLESIDVREPVPYKGHQIVSFEGYDTALCDDCDFAHASKLAFENRECR